MGFIRPVHVRHSGHDDNPSTSGHNGTIQEAAMRTRKTKPTFSSEIELPSERLRLLTITVEHQAPARGDQTWQTTATVLPANRLPPRDKTTLH
jgi:hypothetical protein